MAKPLLIVVDDEPEIAKFVGNAGELVGFDILIAASVNEFQKLYTSRNPLGIILDIVMPDKDGIELINWLAEQGYSSSIIFMSGYDQVYLKAAIQLGAKKGCRVVGSLTKPFTLNELEPLLQQIIFDT